MKIGKNSRPVDVAFICPIEAAAIRKYWILIPNAKAQMSNECQMTNEKKRSSAIWLSGTFIDKDK